ncbi:MAG: BrnT family toxin [Terracidiphilus sp.]
MCYALYIHIRTEWDERKNHLNQRKHGISFELASLIFADPDCLILTDRVDEAGERRWHALGVRAANCKAQS